ncbi:MAG TPA: RdgB/HAM1 family non-canonical purine NTP pyrophosphatase [Anaerovoracaceae bacterium]|nr:RdgB/HAM1 family non-canonical purine NTP pyrophosphatase [Anaerovoracaceae bacterium]
MRIVAATKNRHKIEEIQAIAGEFGMEVVSRDEAGVPDVDIEEDGDTFEANSEKKAREVMELCGKITIADDSGLMVDALGGAPGVISARFAGEDGNDLLNNKKLLSLLSGVAEEDRTARFVSVITMIYPDGGKIVARGECKGHIIYQPRGCSGFGYDPLFVPDGYDRTFAELSGAEKNKISHRAAALRNLRKQLLENRK